MSEDGGYASKYVALLHTADARTAMALRSNTATTMSREQPLIDAVVRSFLAALVFHD